MPNNYIEPLPSVRVIGEARLYLKAAKAIEEAAKNGDLELYWPAAMNTGLALELFLKAFHVKYDPDSPEDMDDPEWDPEGYLKGKKGHCLVDLYQAIDKGLVSRLLEISERLRPGYSLEMAIKDCSNLFVQTRYRYELESRRSFYTQVFELGPHLDQVLEEMIRDPGAGTRSTV